MDRKIKNKYAHIPPRQRWLYYMSDYSAGRLLIWFVAAMGIVLVATFLIVKTIVRYTR